ncbi:hypothetical protein C8J56DRAFT_918113 [Mycena floridula]|nr:hypothetical protein C8J56DRAFT_918113 [Mycena floridula]
MEQHIPASRPSTDSNYSTTTKGPLPLFDAQLRFLTDSYLNFFIERKRIEENYADSLVKLHRKIKALDGASDDRAELSTTRAVWNEVRDNTEREAQARQAFLSVLSEEIIKPLVSLKEIQERTRKRIKEDLKESEQAYTDYAEISLPKIKSRYTKKFSEVEEQKKASTMAVPLSPTIIPPSPDFAPQGSRMNVPGARPTVTAPQPLRAMDRRPSNSAQGARNRSPSSGTAFSDLAHQGKKQLNTLIGFLDKGGSVKDSLGGRENQALRTVRAKRELDEADKEYRNAVHWLETLRLRRTKTLESGYNSLSMFVEEIAVLLQKVLFKYTDNWAATTTTETQLASHARSIVSKISPEKDVSKVTANIGRSLASAIPDPILYEHGQVGQCNDLLFGFSLQDYATANNLQEGEIPRIVRICIREIDARGLDAEGIYRVSGRHANVQTIQHEIERDEATFEFHPRDDIYVVASLLKLYLRELPEPVFKFPLQDRIQHTEDFSDHRANNFVLLRAKMRRLPAVHQATLKAVLEHLARVIACFDKNKMDAKNLAIVFGGVIFGEDEIPKGGDLLSVQNYKDTLMEDLIIHAGILFDDQPHHNSPPLPPTPMGEIPSAVTYGSKSTKVATGIDDFTPRLPARPTSSIHPSARGNPSSPTKERNSGAPPRTEGHSSPSVTSQALLEPDSLSETPSGRSTPSRSPAMSSKTPLPAIGEGDTDSLTTSSTL